MTTSRNAFVRSDHEGEQFVIGSWVITTRVSGAESEGRFEMYHLALGPGSVDYHVHDIADETIHILEGDIEVMKDGQKERHAPGSTVFVPMGVHHGFTNVGSGQARVLLVFSPSSRQNEFFAKVRDLFSNPSPDMAELARLQAEYDQKLVPFPE
jgi:quercetin dioxygenase-like cupin family protein